MSATEIQRCTGPLAAGHAQAGRACVGSRARSSAGRRTRIGICRSAGPAWPDAGVDIALTVATRAAGGDVGRGGSTPRSAARAGSGQDHDSGRSRAGAGGRHAAEPLAARAGLRSFAIWAAAFQLAPDRRRPTPGNRLLAEVQLLSRSRCARRADRLSDVAGQLRSSLLSGCGRGRVRRDPRIEGDRVACAHIGAAALARIAQVE